MSFIELIENGICPSCGEDEIREWHANIYECDHCGNMFDKDI